MIVFGDYAMHDVCPEAVFPNRALLEAGMMKARNVKAALYPDLHASDAFAMVDHQIAHVYVADASRAGVAAELLAKLPGVAEVLNRESQAAACVDHPNSGELMIVADADRWFAYPFSRTMIWPDNGAAGQALGGGLDKPVVIGDFNNDNRDDLALVAPAAPASGQAQSGVAYIVFGHPTFGDFNLGGITNDAGSLPGLMLLGVNANDNLGTSHARFTDINRDGFDDWAIGIPGYDHAGRNNCGAVLIVFGADQVHGRKTLNDVGDPANGKAVPGLVRHGKARRGF